jgi:putative ABC transport system permease protein
MVAPRRRDRAPPESRRVIVSLWRHLSRGVRSLLDGRAADALVDEELQHFIDEAAAELEGNSLPAAEARRAARVRVGNMLAIREDVRASGWEHAVETLFSDVRYAWRRLVRERGFSVVTITTLALGIGSATAMLSVAAPVLVQTLPFPDSRRMHAIWDQTQARARVEIAFGTFVEVQERARLIESMAVARIWQPSLMGSGTPERVEGRSVTSEYFRVFGMLPRLGRAFESRDDVPNAPRIAVLSDRLWRRRFGADPAIIGRQITLDGTGYEVAGVMPAAFEHRLMPQVDVWRALQYDRALPSLQGREWGHHLRMIVRLKPGVSLADASAELDQIARDAVPKFTRAPWATMPAGLLVESLHADLTREARPATLAVLAAAVLLLLIASVNVVNLLLGRDAKRRAELAMRSSLGASRARLVRQLLTETLTMALFGGIGGLLVAGLFLRVLADLGAQGLPLAASAAIDWPVFLLASAVTAMVGVIVGLIPALSNNDLKAGVPQGSWQAGGSRRVIRRGLVIAEVAFTLVLLVGAGLLFQSLRQLFAISSGFDASNVLTMQVQVAGPRFNQDAITQRFFRETLRAVQELPAVTAAALTNQLPLSGDSDVYGVQFESNPNVAAAAATGAFRYAVSPGYFDVMGIPLRRGRSLTDHDGVSAPKVAVISESLARAQFPDVDPIGQRLRIGPTDGPWFTVVGVVGDVKQLSLETNWFSAAYVAPEQWHFADRAFTLVIKTRGPAAALTPAVRNAIWAVDKDQPIVRVATLQSIVTSTARQRSFALLLFEAFGFAALLLTAVGIYGVVSSGVTDRSREIGVRAALGASRSSIVRMIIGEGARMTSIGIAIGMIVAAAAARGLTSLLFGVSRFDVWSYAVVVMTLIAVAALACWIPARRASRIDPALTLRGE